MFGWAYLRRVICISKLIGLALQFEGNLLFLLCFTLCLRAVSKYKPLGGLYLERQFNRGFLHYEFGGLMFGGAYFQNFTVHHSRSNFSLISQFIALDVQCSKIISEPIFLYDNCSRTFTIGHLSTMATLISSVPKVAVAERFNCNLFSKQVSWMQQLGVKPSVQCLL